jgi:hypothetical protein
VLAVDSNVDRVRELRDQHFDAEVRDIRSPEFLQGLPPFDIAFVMTKDHEANLSALKTIKGRLPGVDVIVRANDPVSATVLEAAGADTVLYPQQVFARAAVLKVNKVHANRVSQRLFTLLAGWEGTLGIITHKNPDPVALSSARALAPLARTATPKAAAASSRRNIGTRTGRQNPRDKMERMSPGHQECTTGCRLLRTRRQ